LILSANKRSAPLSRGIFCARARIELAQVSEMGKKQKDTMGVGAGFFGVHNLNLSIFQLFE
jgi:hypothetical protein